MFRVMIACVAIATDGAASPPRRVYTVADQVDVFVQPQSTAYRTDRLNRAVALEVIGRQANGWLAIRPPKGSYCWIQDSDIEESDDGSAARVMVKRSIIRASRETARMPGPPTAVLGLGDEVALRPDLRPLVLRSDRDTTSWRAIEPVAGERRFVRERDVSESPPTPDQQQALDWDRPEKTRRGVANRGPASDFDRDQLQLFESSRLSIDPTLPESFRVQLARADETHRLALGARMAAWDLAAARRAYESLRLADTGPRGTETIESRLALVRRHEALAAQAREVDRLVAAGRRRDDQLASMQAELASRERSRVDREDARGLLIGSNRAVEGRNVYTLVAQDGETAAYLLVPLGLACEQLLGQQVRVWGEIRYDETLQARLIRVRNLEPARLERAPRATGAATANPKS